MPPSSESFGLLAEFNVKKCQKVSETVYVYVFFMYVQIPTTANISFLSNVR